MTGLEGMLGAAGGGLLGTLFVRLAADSSKLVRGMKESELAVTSGSARIVGQLKIMQQAAVSAFTIAGGAAAFFTKQAIDAADAMGKAAQKASQMVDQFSALAGAAALENVTTQDLVVSTRFLAQWMEKAGMSTDNLTEAIIKQADEFAKMSDGSAKLRMLQERFGRGAQELIPFLNQGSAAIRRQMEEQKQLHAVIGPEFAANADQYNDNLSRINTAFKGIFNIVAEQLLPAWIEMQERFIEWVKETDAVANAAGFLLELFDEVRFFLREVAIGFLTVWAAMKSVATIIAGVVTSAFQVLTNHIKAVIRLAEIWVTTFKGIAQGLIKLADTASHVGSVLSAMANRDFKGAVIAAAKLVATQAAGWDTIITSVAEGAKEAGKVVVDTWDANIDTVTGLSKGAVDDIMGHWEEWLGMADHLMTPLEIRAKETNKIVKETTQDVVANMEKAKELLDKVGRPTIAMLDPFTTQSIGIRREEKETQDKLKILEEFAARKLQLTDEMNAAIEERMEEHNKKLKALQMAQAQVVLQAGQQMFDSLAEAAKGFAGEQSEIYKAMFAASKAFAIAESIVKIQQGIANALSLPWPSNLVAAASVISQAAGIVQTIQSVNLAFGGERALGGPVSPGKAFLVGERGPELFAPSQAGAIVPNNQLGTKVIINNYTDIRPEVIERTDETGKVIEIVLRRVKDEISSEIRDGRGEVNRAMENTYPSLRRGR